MKLFERTLVQKQDLNRIIGGEDPGTETNTTDCTWNYKYAGGSSEETGDTSHDGDWYPAC